MGLYEALSEQVQAARKGQSEISNVLSQKMSRFEQALLEKFDDSAAPDETENQFKAF